MKVSAVLFLFVLCFKMIVCGLSPMESTLLWCGSPPEGAQLRRQSGAACGDRGGEGVVVHAGGTRRVDPESQLGKTFPK